VEKPRSKKWSEQEMKKVSKRRASDRGPFEAQTEED
jgi:hypothetical protein